MKTCATKIAVIGGAAAVAFAVGLGGVADKTVNSTATATTSSPSAMPADPTPSVPNTPAGSAGAGVHAAILAGCVSGLDC